MAAEFKTKISADGRQFFNEMAKAEKAGASLGSTLKKSVAGAFAAGAVALATRQLADHIGKIKDLGEQYQITTDQVQAIQVAARSVGLEFEKFGQNLGKLDEARADAVAGNTKLRDAFRRLRVDLNQLADPALNTVDILRKMGGALNSLGINPDTQAALRDLFGVKGGRLAEAIKTLAAETPIKLFDKETIDQVDQMTKNLEMLRQNATAAAAKPAGFLARALNFPLGLFSPKSEPMAQDAKAMIDRARKEGVDMEKFYATFNRASLGFGLDNQMHTLAAFQQFKEVYEKRFGPLHPPKASAASPAFTDPLQVKAESDYADALAAAQQKLLDLEFSRMDVAEKRAQLEREIGNLRARASEFEGVSLQDDIEAARIRGEILEKQQELEALRGVRISRIGGGEYRPYLNELQRVGGYSGAHDRLARIGGFAGRGGADVSPKLDKIVTELQNVRNEIRRLEGAVFG